MYAKASKCEFHKPSVEYLGYIVSGHGLKMDKTKVQTILDWPEPRNLKALQSFLGFANFYQKFIFNYSKKTCHLSSLTKKDIKCEFDPEAQKQFEALKLAFTTAPILQHFNPELSTTIETDASDYALGAILSQVLGNPKVKHPVAFNS